jgi:hypothetical protein
MTKTEFYQLHGGDLEIVNPDDVEYGEYLILHPEEAHVASNYCDQGHPVFTVYEEAEVGGDEFVEPGFDCSTNPFKVGYLILKKGTYASYKN